MESYETVGAAASFVVRRFSRGSNADLQTTLQIALESGRLGSFEIDIATWTLTKASDICKAHFGRMLHESLTLNDVIDAIHTGEGRSVERIEWIMSGGRDYVVEYRIVWRDGSVHGIAVHGVVANDDQGFPTRLVGVVQDITDRKRWERLEALEEPLAREHHDPLTGLLNHRALHERLEQEALRRRCDGRTLAVAILDLDNFRFFNDVYGRTTGDCVLRQVAERLRDRCRPCDIVARFGGDEFCVVMTDVDDLSDKSAEEYLAGVMRGLDHIPAGHDNLIPIMVSIGTATMDRGSADWKKAIDLAYSRLRTQKSDGTFELQLMRLTGCDGNSMEAFSMLNALVVAVDNKDRYTRRHSEDVMAYSVMIAAELGLGDSVQNTVAITALLHDVGKIGVPDAILRKPGYLDEKEFAAVKKHAEMGAAIVSAVKGFEGILDGVRHHHERWDGQGYPCGLSGEEIPLLARLMAVADAFSAMTTDRPYRRSMSKEQARSILKNGSDTHWDGRCVDALLRGLDNTKR